MQTAESIAEALARLKGKRVLVLTHHNADIDAMASAIALTEGLKQSGAQAVAGAAESISKAAQQLAKGYEVLIDPDCSKFDSVVLVDTSVPEQLATVKNIRADFVIDHHPAGKLAEKAECYIDENAKSTAQLVYALLKKMNLEIDEKLAKILSAGIVADTAHFRHADAEVFSTMAELSKIAKFSDVLLIITSEEVDPSARVAALKAAKRMEIYKCDDLLIAFSNLSSHEAAACRALMKLGADIAIVFAEKEKELRISSRAREKILGYKIDLSEIFQEVGRMIEGSGGGHALAGSANGKSKPLQPIKKFLLKRVAERVGKPWKRVE